MLRRIIFLLAAAILLAVMLVGSAGSAFAQPQQGFPHHPAGTPFGVAKGPEGGNPGQGLSGTAQSHFPEQAGTENAGFQPCPLPLPLGGTHPEAAFTSAPQGVVDTAPGTPFSGVNPGEVCPA